MRKETSPWPMNLGNVSSRIEKLPQARQDLGFAMNANGYSLRPDGIWQATEIQTLQEDASHLDTVFRAPYFTSLNHSADTVIRVLNQTPVLDVVARYREIDEGEAGRISFLLGGIARSLKGVNRSDSDIAKAVAYVANMAKLGERKSSEAIVAAMAMHVLSGGSLEEDRVFKGDVYHMGEAIAADPISPWETADLGMSQAARLLGFVRKRRNEGVAFFPAIEVYQDALTYGLPTIGAEFHILPTDYMHDSFWQKVAMLNLSQYQSGSHMPFSKTEEGLIEIRMNPSIYPVATATWKLMGELLPEIKKSYFTMTINRRDANFSGRHDEDLSRLLHRLGNLYYAAFFAKVPQIATPKQVNFGDRYLGQTVRATEGKFSLTGNWRGGRGEKGQLNICSGYGDLFEGMAFYLSMGLAEPALLEMRVLGHDIFRAEWLKDAIKFDGKDIRDIFTRLNRSIVSNPRLSHAARLGERIMEQLSLGEVED